VSQEQQWVYHAVEWFPWRVLQLVWLFNSSRDILSLLRTAVLTEKPRSTTAFRCEIVRDAFAKRERCGNILQPATSVIFDTLLQYVHMSAVMFGVKASTSFDAMYSNHSASTVSTNTSLLLTFKCWHSRPTVASFLASGCKHCKSRRTGLPMGKCFCR